MTMAIMAILIAIIMAIHGNYKWPCMARIKGIIMAITGNDQGHTGNANGHTWQC